MRVGLIARAFALSAAGLLTTSVTAAAASEAVRHIDESRNVVSVGPRVAYHNLRSRDATERGAPTGENLGGVVIVYERILASEAWAIAIAKPFLFNGQRFDSPFDLQGKRIIALGDWELFAGVGLTFNLRFFRNERGQEEDRSSELTLGIVTSAGVTHRYGERFTVSVEAGYGWIPLSHVVEHELNGALVTGYAF